MWCAHAVLNAPAAARDRNSRVDPGRGGKGSSTQMQALAVVIALALTTVALFPVVASGQGHVDLILVHGKIWTENPRQPEAEAVAIQGNRIVEVGDSSSIQKLAGPKTRIIDLGGRRVVPGFNDAHVHFYMGGDGITSVQLHEAASPAEFRKRIAEFARTRPKGEWILNGNWDHERWTPARLPTHQLIDEVTSDNPVFVNRSDGHMCLANALAMKLAGIDKNTEDVPGGVIVRDADGNPTGIFKDAAKSLVERVEPHPSMEQILSAIKAAQAYATENGVTSVQDMGVFTVQGVNTMADVIRGYQILEKRGELEVRVSTHLPLVDWKRLASAGVMADFGSEKLQMGALKSFADGSLGSTTAWFYEPYSDAPTTSGIPSPELLHPEEMYAEMRSADRAGLQIAVHAIGDRAIRAILDMFEKLEMENGVSERRLRIEHAQHLSPADIPRFAKLHVVASMQPYHAIDDGRWADKRIGPERVKTTYAFRSLLDAGAVLAFGSDWFVAPMNPLAGIYAAVTRRTLDGKNPDGWVPQQKISVAEAVHAYTMGSAFASLEDGLKGSIEPGKLADLAVLSDDIFHMNPVEILNSKVNITIFDGKVIFERK
jgi:predicted amidohydrolase YtcJ